MLPVFYLIASNTGPAIIKPAPMAVLSVNASFKNTTDRIIAIATLSLSTGAEIVRKTTFCFDSAPIPLASPLANTIHQIIKRITMVLIPVARLELTFATPSLANIAVSSANKADNKA